MYVKRNYSFWMTFNWSKKPFIYGAIYATVVTLLYVFINDNFGLRLILPWNPIGIMGITVAFYLGFKNNASYDRTWEARKIWGGIVNNSRSFGMAVNAFVQGPDSAAIKKELIYRHIAWLTALRYQLRVSREWEHNEDRIKGIFYPEISDKFFEKLDQDLLHYLSEEEIDQFIKKANPAVQILKNQGVVLQKLHDEGYFNDFRHIELHKLMTTFYDEQGKSERIKNFPFPRQYASAALWQAMIFSALIPFGLLEVLSDKEYNTSFIWLNIPLTGLIIWVFFLMEKIGDYSENPFEGSYNDVPITSISRGIEIDLRQMIDDEDIPPPIKSEHGYLM